MILVFVYPLDLTIEYSQILATCSHMFYTDLQVTIMIHTLY